MLSAAPRLWLPLVGALAALAAGGVAAYLINAGQEADPAAAPPASQGGLVIDSSGASLGRIEETKPLRCFVGGRLVGELSLKDCALRNGVATDALDVGLDPSGALAAGEKSAAVTPLPPPVAAIPANPAVSAPVGTCWRYADNRWRRLPSDTTLNGCVQALFAGRCEAPGNASYGRWGQQTLRLAPGKVEISADNHSFRTLAEQHGPGCAIAAVGG